MLIISHRGYWKTASEKNTQTAFERSFSLGFGTETDLRDLDRQLVIAHDPPPAGAMPASEMFAQVARHDPSLPMALNIKSDGLQDMVMSAVAAHGLMGCFVFDMAVPDALQWLKTDMAVFTRHSDAETVPAFYDRAAGVWLDSFGPEWWDASVISDHLAAGKRVAVVSSELHGRDHSALWALLKKAEACQSDDVILCTDIPEAASEYFGS